MKYIKCIVIFVLLILFCLSSCANNTQTKPVSSKKSDSSPKRKETESYLQKDAIINYKNIPYYYFDDPVEKIASNKSKVLSYLNSVQNHGYTINQKEADTDYEYCYCRNYLNGFEIVDLTTSLYKYIEIPEKIDGKKVIKLGGTFEKEFPENKGNYFYRVSTRNTVGENRDVKTIHIPRYLKEIVNGTFDEFECLERIEVDKNNAYYSSKDGVLYNKRGTKKLLVPKKHKSKLKNKKRVSYYGFTDPLENLKPTKKNAEKYDKLRKTTTLKDKTRAAYRHYKNGVEIIWQEDYGINLKPTEDNYISVPAYIKGKPVIKLGGEYGDEDPIWEGKDDFYKYYYFINCFSGSNATKIYLPATVKEIVKGTFDINELESIEVDKNNPYYSSKDGILYDKSGKIRLYVPPNHHSLKK